MALVVKTHITSMTQQKSYASAEDLENVAATDLLKGRSGRLFNIFVTYDSNTTGFLHFYDGVRSSEGTVDVTNQLPIMTVPLKGTTFKMSITSQQGIEFSTMMSVAAKAGAAIGASSAPHGRVDVFLTGN